MQITHSFNIEILSVKKLGYKVPHYKKSYPPRFELSDGGYEVFGKFTTQSRYPYQLKSGNPVRERVWYIDAIMIADPIENEFVRVGFGESSGGSANDLLNEIAAEYLRKIDLTDHLIPTCHCSLDILMSTGCTCGGR